MPKRGIIRNYLSELILKNVFIDTLIRFYSYTALDNITQIRGSNQEVEFEKFNLYKTNNCMPFGSSFVHDTEFLLLVQTKQFIELVNG